MTEAAGEQARRMLTHLQLADASVQKATEQAAGGPYAPLEPELKALSEQHIAPAEKAGERVSIASAAQTRAELAEEADFHIQQPLPTLSRLMERFGALAEAARRRQQLEQLSQDQARLAEASTELNRERPDRDQQW